MSTIPKIIHQLWIGPKPPPVNFMKTWKDIHEPLGYEYILWNEEEFKKRGFTSKLQNKINDIEEICGKADILRLEILYHYGGIFVDADSICIEPFCDLLKLGKSFVGYENEIIRNSGWWTSKEYDDVLARTHPLIANGTMAFSSNHDLLRLAIEWIKNNNVSYKTTKRGAWRNVGPGLLTRLYFSKQWDDITILPSYYFIPIHAKGIEYKKHGRVFAYQEWGSTKNNYDIMNNISLPTQFLKPNRSISILMPFYNTNISYLKETLESIKDQFGYIIFNLICINDGSDSLHTNKLKQMLLQLKYSTRWINIYYYENKTNIGIGATLHKGILLCPDEIIFRVDSHNLMLPTRIIKQLDFMDKTPDCVLCGTQIQFLSNNILGNKTNHPSMTFNEYKNQPLHCSMNHSTFCFKKSKILEVGNYNIHRNRIVENFELILKVLKKYNKIYNIPEVLVYYRLHNDQLTHKRGNEGEVLK